MPVVSILHGIAIYMYFMDGGQHELPHLHARYRGGEAVVSIPGGKILEGNLPADKAKLLKDWIRLHREELMKNWEIIVSGQHPYKIEPLDSEFLHHTHVTGK